MNKKVWKVGIVGFGKIAGERDYPKSDGTISTYAQAYFRHPNFQLNSVVETNDSKLIRIQKEWHFKYGFTSLDEMLKAGELDVISICTPNKLHYSNAVQILTSETKPKVLFIEKPVCYEPNELQHLIKLSKKAGVEIIVNHSRRYDPAHRQLSKIILSKTLGELLYGYCTYYGGWLNNGIHLVDTVFMLFNDKPKIISSIVSSVNEPDDVNIDLKLMIGNADVNFKGFDEKYYQLFESEFLFEFGRIKLEDFGLRIVIEKVKVNELDERILTRAQESPLKGLDSPLYHAINAICDFLNGKSTFNDLGVDLRTVKQTMELVWEARGMAGIKHTSKHFG